MVDKKKFTKELFNKVCLSKIYEENDDGNSTSKDISEEDTIKVVKFYAKFLNKIFYDVGKIKYGYDLSDDGYDNVNRITRGKYNTLGEILEKIAKGDFSIYFHSYVDDMYCPRVQADIDVKNISSSLEMEFGEGFIHIFCQNGDVDYSYDDEGNRFNLYLYFTDKKFKVEYEDTRGSFFIEEFEDKKYQKRYVNTMYDLFGSKYIKNLKSIFAEKKAQIDNELEQIL